MISDGAAMNRWRLVLGKNADPALSLEEDGLLRMDAALDFLYGREQQKDVRDSLSDRESRTGGNDPGRPTPVHWLQEVRTLFPKETAEILQRHALERYQMADLLKDPEVLEKMTPNMDLLRTIISLNGMISGRALGMARKVVAQVAEQLKKKLETEIRRSALGKRDRSSSSPLRTYRNLDLQKTVRRNLGTYDPKLRSLIPKNLYFTGYARHVSPWHLIIAVDESGSMLDNIIHSAVMAGIFAKIPSLRISLVIFDTSVVDLSDRAEDPVELMMTVTLGGGTDIAGALVYCRSLITQPRRTITVLISDLYEGGPLQNLMQICHEIMEGGSRLVVLPSLDHDCVPQYDRAAAQQLADLGAHVGVMTPSALADFIAGIMK